MASADTSSSASGGTNSIVSAMNRIGDHKDVFLAVGILAVLGLLVLPLNPFLLDIFLGLSLTISVLVLMVSVYLNHALEMSSFPTVLLLTTLFRLGLNIATTRLILGEGVAGHHRPGPRKSDQERRGQVPVQGSLAAQCGEDGAVFPRR